MRDAHVQVNAPMRLKYVQDSGKGYTAFDYKCNRAVVFDSLLLHETQRQRFKKGYKNRRINLTLLFAPAIFGDAPEDFIEGRAYPGTGK